MTDMALPAPTGAALAVSTATAMAGRIRALALQHGASLEHTPLDAFAADVSRLSDAEVPQNAIAGLLIALKRWGVLDNCQAISLHGDHLHEKELQCLTT